LGVNYRLEPKLVRGLDYYTRTVFEITSPVLGAQDALGGGGRYDNLIESLGGPALGAMGCAFGMERIIIALQSVESLKGVITAPRLTVYITTFDDATRQKGFELLAKLRQNKISAEIDYEGRSLKSQMRQASRLNAKFVVIIGQDELASGSAKIKKMLHTEGVQHEVSSAGGEESIAFNQITDYFKRTI
jgi:histidyl-tRNA synthetase